MPTEREAITKAEILCRREGRRLRPLTQHFKKVTIPIGPKMRPLLEFVMKPKVYHGVPDIVSTEALERLDDVRLGMNMGFLD